MKPEPPHSRRTSQSRPRNARMIQALFILGILFVLTAFCLAQAASASADVIRVEISRLHSDEGQAECALFASAADFPKHADKAIARAKSGITHGHAVCEFSAIAPGRYAVSVFHDENSNGKMDTNFVGMPREGVGASNNARGHFGPPKFEDAAFRYAGGKLDLTITIAYL
jgi:uncharacterized protein (DUF2141 family)